MLSIAEFTVGIEVFEFGGDGFSAGLAMFLEAETFLAKAGERVDDASIGARVFGEHFLEAARGEVAEGLVDLNDSGLDRGLAQVRILKALAEFGGGFFFDTGFGQPVLLAQPVAVCPLVVPPEVVDVQSLAVGAECGQNGRIGETFEEQLIDPVADGFVQQDDFSFGTVGRLAAG